MGFPCSYYIERRRFTPGREYDFHDHSLSPLLLEAIREEPLSSAAVLDLGCGAGRLILALASEAQRAVGLDWSEEAIQQARQQAEQEGHTNVEFCVADVDTANYADLLGCPTYDMVVANLCMSDAMIQRSAQVLPAGRCLCFAAFHHDQWHETGRPSRFAYRQERLAQVLAEAGFRLERMAVEQEIVTFDCAEAALTHYFTPGSLIERWRKDGRLNGLEAYFQSGGRTFTAKSHLIVKARRT